jgi:hypothetical protein
MHSCTMLPLPIEHIRSNVFLNSLVKFRAPLRFIFGRSLVRTNVENHYCEYTLIRLVPILSGTTFLASCLGRCQPAAGLVLATLPSVDHVC